MLGTRTVLGLAIDESGIIVAEVGARVGRSEVRRVGHWDFAETLNADNAQDLGRQFKEFLRSNHFSSKQAMVGIPTKWIVAKEIVAPPAGADALAGLLAIQAERAFSLNASELIFDYCGVPSTSKRAKIMLLAARRQRVDQIRTLVMTAGLQVQAVTVSALAFDKTPAPAGVQQRYGLYARPSYCEFWSRSGDRPETIRHIPMTGVNGTPDDRVTRLTATLQRLMLLLPQQSQSPPYHVTLYDACGLGEGALDRLNEQLAPQIRVGDGEAELLAAGLASVDSPERSQSMAAAAVAMTGVGTARPSVDFLNPRIGRKETSSRKRLVGWAAFVAVVCIVAVGAVLADWQMTRSDIATYTEQLETMGEDLGTARDVVERMSYARSWTSQKPEFLECLRHLTLAFPETPSVWATSLALTENAEGSLVGRATDDASVIEVQDNIKQNEAFSDVQMIHIRDVGRNSTEKEFAVKFKFQGVR